MTMISKKFLLFEVSISNRPVFRADREYANENCDKRIFWPPEGRKVGPPTPKNLQTAITRSIFAQIIFPFAQTFLSIKNCLLQKETKIQENFFLRLEFTKLSGPMAVMKNLKKKKFSCENKKCLYVINKHFLFPKLIAKMSR